MPSLIINQNKTQIRKKSHRLIVHRTEQRKNGENH